MNEIPSVPHEATVKERALQNQCEQKTLLSLTNPNSNLLYQAEC